MSTTELRDAFCVNLTTASRLLGVSKQTASRLLKGRIIALGNRVKRVRLSDVEALIAERTLR